MALTAAAGQRTSRLTRFVPRWTGVVLNYALLFLIALIFIGPFLMMLLAALTPNQFYLVFPPVTDPRRMGFGNFETLFSSSLMPRWILNSFVVSGAITFLQPFTSALAAYVFARKSLPGLNVLFWSLMITIMVPGIVTLIPFYIYMSKVQWVDTYHVLIWPHSVSVFGIFFLRQAIVSIPREYDEAARLDGCADRQILWYVIVPMIRPSLATLATLVFLNVWTEYLYPLVMITSNQLLTLEVGLATFQSAEGNQSLRMASAALSFVPTLVVFLALQKHIVKGLHMTGIKG